MNLLVRGKAAHQRLRLENRLKKVFDEMSDKERKKKKTDKSKREIKDDEQSQSELRFKNHSDDISYMHSLE